jgi:hypothetical protein
VLTEKFTAGYKGMRCHAAWGSSAHVAEQKYLRNAGFDFVRMSTSGGNE